MGVNRLPEFEAHVADRDSHVRAQEERAERGGERVARFLERVCVLGCETDRLLEFVVLLVDVLIDARMVQRPMRPINMVSSTAIAKAK